MSLCRIAVAVVLVLMATPCSATPPFDQADVERLVRDALRVWDVPGAAVVVIPSDGVPWVRGFGKRSVDADAAIGPDTIFPLASCSKAFTTTLAAMLADEGKLSLDDPVRKHLPTFRLSDAEADANATLRDVFCHRTGLGPHDFLWYHAKLPMNEVVRRAGLLPFDKPFRTAFQYQSALYTAGGFAVARAAGVPWDRLCRERVFEPLGMRGATCVTPPQRPGDDVAMPHKPDAAGKLRRIAYYVQAEPNPAGSIHLSARDLVPWLRLHLDGGKGGVRPRLGETHEPHVAIPIDAPTRELHPDTNLMSYALGWLAMDYRGHGLVTHAGMIDGFRVQLTLVPRQQVAVAVLVNRHQSRATNAITNGLLDRLLGLPPRHWNGVLLDATRREEQAAASAAAERERRRSPGKPPKPVADYAGTFESPIYGRMTVRADGDGLTWEWSAFRSSLRYFGGTTFTVECEFLGTQTVEYTADGIVLFGVPFKRT